MRRILAMTVIAMPDLAYAHVGHLGDLASHSHWIALGALGIAAAVGALASAKGKRKERKPVEEAASRDTSGTQEAAA